MFKEEASMACENLFLSLEKSFAWMLYKFSSDRFSLSKRICKFVKFKALALLICTESSGIKNIQQKFSH